MSDADSSDELEPQEAIVGVAVLVAEWLLVEGCSKRTAARRLQDIAGTRPEARSMVGIVHAILKSALGGSYHRLPKDKRRAHFAQIDTILGALARFDI